MNPQLTSYFNIGVSINEGKKTYFPRVTDITLSEIVDSFQKKNIDFFVSNEELDEEGTFYSLNSSDLEITINNYKIKKDDREEKGIWFTIGAITEDLDLNRDNVIMTKNLLIDIYGKRLFEYNMIIVSE